MAGKDVEEILAEMESAYKYPLTYGEWSEALKEGKIKGIKCKECGAITAPPFSVCQRCRTPFRDFEIVDLSGQGEIMSYTIIFTSPEGFEAPYVVALVKTDEGAWIPARLDVDVERAQKEFLVGKRVSFSGPVVIPGDKFNSGQERVNPVFSLTG
ncbi:MAG TPA: Zn-ribbon domain-containing OB-fold protein [Candidatus Syntrophoarchaeum butanivorans]|uniref:Protein containing DUF35 n=1 Tax=Candidatus Syntropharchaeum butanivorans TaxID=1839936 RepID=A0A1F2P761_9EURY|nr:MAG: protein containing DUF35 [Candidatus Syntrophoarchaeum butanivorans]RJS71930.1 MAG: Zn-ribbon domain-containing OB-fold protein [Candidatus Syntrophoarchaeum sp. WYZ-LMO15]HEC56661.1 Zn-ribbon domain-containing OB-fold protein [Candidatus Syntrophoarchaeum butanivorans]